MDKGATEAVAHYLAKDYRFNIKLCEGFCPACFSGKYGKTTTIETYSKSVKNSPTSNSEVAQRRFNLWMELFTEGGADPIQVLNVYRPEVKGEGGRLIGNASFSSPILNLEKPGKVCGGPTCEPKCIACGSFLGHLPTHSVDGWTVHDVCSAQCGFIPSGSAKSACCKNHARTVPKFFEDNLKICIRCSDHRHQGKPHQSRQTAASEMSPVIRPVPAPVHRDASSKQLPKPPPKRKLLPIERVRVQGNHDIAKMMFPEKYDKPEAKKPKQEEKKPSYSETLGASSGRLGAAFLYGKSQGFDFTPPRTIQQPSSDTDAHQTNEDKASASAADGEP